MTAGDKINIMAQIATLKEIAMTIRGRQSTTLSNSWNRDWQIKI